MGKRYCHVRICNIGTTVFKAEDEEKESVSYSIFSKLIGYQGCKQLEIQMPEHDVKRRLSRSTKC